MSVADSNRTGVPPDLQVVLDDLDKSDRVARELIGGLSDAQANWQPSKTAWSIAQCLDHLARASAQYSAALREAITNPDALEKRRAGPIQPGGRMSAYFIRSLEPPPKTKMRAPRKIIPATRIGAQEALESFVRTNEAMRAVVREGAGLDLNRIRFRNPFFGFLRFTVGTGLLITSAHNRRHLWQAEQVRRSTGFPVS